ncbi:alpha/beta fold hydrolase [Roseimaritima sediminicola]|uniref:alpha/beta fold hydrolase n=1 Tax=Roseimaritima sediminicola TaxID=2662066 RepID=UPI0012982FBE|nr:alpha/beta hydrolase [Roseimaritima sediminicola]
MLRIKAAKQPRQCCPIDLSQVVDLGEGPETILFLHGLFGTPEHWLDVMETLSDRYRVVAPQLPIDPQPGRRHHGMQTIGDLSQAVEQLVDQLELDQVVLCGNSLGGLVAIDLCVKHPEMASGLVLAGSAGLFERSPIRGLRAKPTRSFVRSTIEGILYDESIVSDALVDHWHAALSDRDYVRFLLRVSRATRDRTVEDELSQLQLPTLIIWGRNDEITPPSTGEEFQRRIAGSRLAFIEECGHAPNWERPDAFAEQLQAFLPECFATA